MKLVLTRYATENIAEISDFIRKENPGAATRVCSAILSSLRTISDFPRIGRPQTAEAVRRFPVRRYPYSIYYLVDEANDQVVVLTVRHQARANLIRDE